MGDRPDSVIRDDFHSINNLLNKITTQSGMARYRLEMKGIDQGKIEEEKAELIKVMDDVEENAMKVGEILKGLRKAFFAGGVKKTGNKMLIVDDEKDIALVIKEFFVSKGYEALTAFSGSEAMAFLSQPGIGLILLDMHMPDMNGIEILKEAKKRYRDVKIIVLSGYLNEYREEAEKLGCDVYLTKPFSVKMLIKIVESVLAGREEDRKRVEALISDDNVLAKAKLLFIEPNEIMYSSKQAYFRDSKYCKGKYQFVAAFNENEALEKLSEFKPDIILSDISIFRLYNLYDKISKLSAQPKDVILYGIPVGNKDIGAASNASFVGDLFDSMAAIINSEEVASLGRIVRQTAIEYGLYRISGAMTSEQFDNYHRTLLEASKGMALIPDTRKLLRIIVYVVKKHMRLRSACVFYYDESVKGYTLKSRRGECRVEKGYKIDEAHPLISWLKDRKNSFSFNKGDFKESAEAGLELERLGCAACVPSFNKDKLIGFLVLGGKSSGESYTYQELELLQTIANETAIVIENAENLLELKKLKEKEKENYFQTILALARTVDEKDSYTRGHLDEVSIYGMIVAEELVNMKNIKIDVEELKISLLLHDIGKIGVPDALLYKTSKLTTEEFDIMKQHAEIGARIIEPIEKLRKVGNIIRHHQEKYDGTGYPEGLKGEEIPVEARIVSVVDAYHAMISDRPYRKALPEEVALNELKTNSGTQFDPIVVEAFIKAYEKGKIIKSRKY